MTDAPFSSSTAGTGAGPAPLGLPAFEGVGMAVILAHPGPAALLDDACRVIASNRRADLIRDLFDSGDTALVSLAATTLDNGVPAMKSVEIRRGAQVSCLDLIFLPATDGKRLAVLGRDSSLEMNLRSALAESRQRYKDFVDLSSDFVWETGADGRFVFVSPGGALGYDAGDLVGADPGQLLDNRAGSEATAVFRTNDRVKDLELWARRKDGTTACLITSAMPVIGGDGQWMGARGVCQDVTEQRERDQALSRARNRDRILTHVVRSFRDEMDPSNMLNVAAESLARGLGTEACQIYKTIDSQNTDHPEFALRGSFGVGPNPDQVTDLLADLDASGPSQEHREGSWHLLTAAARYRRRINGAVLLCRTAGRGPWTDDDRLLIMDIANQIGIANEQIGQHERIITMSRTDSLTGLLNRRAFFEDIDRRIRRLERSPRPGALLYLDLDNFKLVNDVHGHLRGDEALLVVKEILTSRTRPTDLIARLGGDEFAIWLDGATHEAAAAKAEDFIAQSRQLECFSGDPQRPLTMSIGLALFDPDSQESLEAFTARADSAMYEAKHAGKGRFQIARSPRDLILAERRRTRGSAPATPDSADPGTGDPPS